jgi:hypothetical protein
MIKKIFENSEELKNDVEVWSDLMILFSEDIDDEEDLLEQVINLIRDCCSDSEESIDSCDIVCNYFRITEKFRYEVTGESYRKDGCVCDEEMVQELTVINLAEELGAKENKKKEKRIKEEEKWISFFRQKTKEQILEELKQYDFPKIK